MNRNRTVAFIYAHPDDETFGCSFWIRHIADEGGYPILLSATLGDAGKSGRLGEMTKEQLAVKREQELRNAGGILGLAEIEHLRLPDGKLKEVDPVKLRESIADFLRRHGADIVVTFPEDGISGHADHIVIHHAVNDVVFSGEVATVQKLYYNGIRPETNRSCMKMSGDQYWEMKRRALECHESQVLSIERAFGDIANFGAASFSPEYLVLVWERGEHFPKKTESTIYDDLNS
ncbi:1D-myo-inositol 2-acetamido-2-deoxy-alpha-D-glucopyranoside deacetylase [compost metagenome]